MNEQNIVTKERERLAAILTHEQAALNQDLARKLAFSGIPAGTAIQTLDRLKKKQQAQSPSKFEEIMSALNPDLGADLDTDHEPSDFESGRATTKLITEAKK